MSDDRWGNDFCDAVQHKKLLKRIEELKAQVEPLQPFKERILKLEAALLECKDAVRYTNAHEHVTRTVNDALGFMP